MNQPPTRLDIERAFGPNTPIDRVLPVGDTFLVLYHTANTDHHALVQRSWGRIDILQSGSVRPETTLDGTAQVSYHPIFLATKTGQLVQGQVLLPDAQTVQIVLDDHDVLSDTLTIGRFGVTYFDTQAMCRVDIYDAGAAKIGEYHIAPFVPHGSDRTRYDCAP